MAVSDRHDLRPLLQVKVTLVVERLGDAGEDVLQETAPNPLLKASMAALIPRLAVWAFRRECARPQDPEDSVEQSTVLGPRPPTTASCGTTARARGAQGFPIARQSPPAGQVVEPSSPVRLRAK
jgi:hypothetical protein